MQKVAFLIITFLVFRGIASAEVVKGLILEDHTSAPVPAAMVKLLTNDGVVLKEMESDRSGRFITQDLPHGNFQLSITKSNYSTVTARMTSQPDTDSLPVVRLIKYGVISGHITSPRMGGTVVAVEQVSGGQMPRSYSAMISANGNFRIFGVTPGRYQLAALLTAATASEPVRGMALYPSNAQPREFVFNGGEEFSIAEFTVSKDGASFISGKVTGPGTPQLFSLTLVESEHPSIRLMTALTAEGGAFHFDSILPGTYDLFATGPVTPPPSFFAHRHFVLNSQRVENIELVLEPGRPVEFVVSSGNSLASNSVCSLDGVLTLQAVGSWGLVRDQKLTAPISSTAPAHFENVGPGPFNVTARSTSGNCIGVVPTSLDLRKDTASERATVVFQPPSSIHGSIANGNVVVLRDVTPGHDSAVQAIFANSAAEYHFDALAAGRYCVTTQSAIDEISHWSPEAGCENVVIDLRPGESRRL